MFRLTIKNLLDKKIRFALTTIAVVVSVAMVVGVFVLTDSLRSSFNGCLLYTSPSPRDRTRSRMPSSA